VRLLGADEAVDKVECLLAFAIRGVSNLRLRGKPLAETVNRELGYRAR
jgi:hypothetical protein